MIWTWTITHGSPVLQWPGAEWGAHSTDNSGLAGGCSGDTGAWARRGQYEEPRVV